MISDAHELSVVFGKVAEDYELGRPNVPLQASVVLAHLGVRPRQRILELAAGTGKLTRLLVAMGADLVATEPNPGMRATFHRMLPNVGLLNNSAHDLPADDGEFDVVIAADAFHWFDATDSYEPILRALKPGGYVVSVESHRTFAPGWAFALEVTLNRYRKHDPESVMHNHLWKTIMASPGFDNEERYEVEHEEIYDVQRLVAFVKSLHYVANLDNDKYDTTISAVKRLAEQELDKTGYGLLPLSFTTTIASAQKRAN